MNFSRFIFLSIFVTTSCFNLVSPTKADTSTESKDSTEEKVTLEKVTLCRFPSYISSLFYIADKENLFKKEGLEPNYHEVTNGKLCQDEVVAGQADFTLLADAPFAYLSAGKHNLKILASTGEGKGVSIIANQDKNIKNIEDLKGKRLAVLPGTISSIFIYKLLEYFKWSKESLTLISLQPQTMVQAIQGGQIDAFAMWEPWNSQALKNLGSKGIKFKGEKYFDYQTYLIARDETISSRPEVIKKVLKVMKASAEFVAKEPKPTKDILSSALKMDPEVLEESLKDFTFQVNIPQNSIKHLEETFNLIKKYEADFSDVPSPDFSKYFYAKPLLEVENQTKK